MIGLDFLEQKKLSTQFNNKIEKLKVLAFDVDGILTDGKIYWDGDDRGYNRFFNVLDGYGMKIMQRAGFKVGVISGGDSLGVAKRFKDNLKLDFAYLGKEDKRESYLNLLSGGYSPEEVFYMGDELFDIPLLKKSGFSATVLHADQEVKYAADYICVRSAGEGCAREVIDIIRMCREIKIKIPDFDE